MSILGRSRTVSADAVRRLGPSVSPGNRIPIRGKRTGSVRIFIPKKLINTVAWPSHAAVIRLSLHSAGFVRAKAGALDAGFRQSIRARGKRTYGERVNRRDFGFYFSSNGLRPAPSYDAGDA